MFKSKEELEVERIYRRVEDLLKQVTASESAAEESIEKKYFNIWKGEKSMYVLQCIRTHLEWDFIWYCVREKRSIKKMCLDLKIFIKKKL